MSSDRNSGLRSQSHPDHQVEMDRNRQYVKEEGTKAIASGGHKPSLPSTFFEYLLGLKIIQILTLRISRVGQFVACN